MLRALVEIGNILGVSQQGVPALPARPQDSEVWVQFLAGLPKEQLLELHRKAFAYGLVVPTLEA